MPYGRRRSLFDAVGSSTAEACCRERSLIKMRSSRKIGEMLDQEDTPSRNKGSQSINSVNKRSREGTVTRAQMLMELSDATAYQVQVHVGCYYVWVVERQAYEREPSGRLPAARPAAPALSSEWAPSRRARREFGAPTAASREPWSSSSFFSCGG